MLAAAGSLEVPAAAPVAGAPAATSLEFAAVPLEAVVPAAGEAVVLDCCADWSGVAVLPLRFEADVFELLLSVVVVLVEVLDCAVLG